MDNTGDASAKLRNRLTRYQELAELLAATPAGARFHAFASDIQWQLHFLDAQRLTSQACTHYRQAMREAMDTIIAQSRLALSASKFDLQRRPFSAEDLREESRLCMEEARDCDDHQDRLGLARQAFNLAALGEAFALPDRQ